MVRGSEMTAHCAICGPGMDRSSFGLTDRAFHRELSARLREAGEEGEALYETSLSAFTGRFHPDEKLVPPDVIAGRGGTPAGEGLVQQFQVDDLVGFHEEPVGKTATAGAAGLIAQQLDRPVEDSVIVRFEDARLIVIHQPKQAHLFDRHPDQWNRFEQRHPPPLWRVRGETYFSRK